MEIKEGQNYRAKGQTKEWELNLVADDGEVVLVENNDRGWVSGTRRMSKEQFVKNYEPVPRLPKPRFGSDYVSGEADVRFVIEKVAVLQEYIDEHPEVEFYDEVSELRGTGGILAISDPSANAHGHIAVLWKGAVEYLDCQNEVQLGVRVDKATA